MSPAELTILQVDNGFAVYDGTYGGERMHMRNGHAPRWVFPTAGQLADFIRERLTPAEPKETRPARSEGGEG
jgi:hypothetical protein